MKHLRKFGSKADMETALANSTIGVIGLAYDGGNAVIKSVTPAPVTKYTVFIMADPDDGGTFTGDGNYSYGQVATLTAIPATGFDFVQWDIDGTIITDTTYNLTVTGDHFVIVTFVRQVEHYTLSAIYSPADADTVCSIIGLGIKEAGESPWVEASDASPYVFDHWEYGTTTSPQKRFQVVNMSSDVQLTAVFRYIHQDRTITVTSNNPSYGSVQIEDYQHQTSSTSLVIPECTNATLTATPNAGYQFEGWYYNNEKVSSDAVYTFTLPDHSTDRTYTANFSVAQA